MSVVFFFHWLNPVEQVKFDITHVCAVDTPSEFVKTGIRLGHVIITNAYIHIGAHTSQNGSIHIDDENQCP